MTTMENDQEFGHEKPNASDAEPEGKIEQQEKGRRDFLKQAGLLGVGSGLAHFVALGGILRKSHAANDHCGYPYNHPRDVCEPNPSNYNHDECQMARPEGGTHEPETGDTCKMDDPWYNDLDVCNPDMEPAKSGDECKTGFPWWDLDEPV